MSPTLILTSYNMGGDATASDYGAWVSYVNEHIDAAVGTFVLVDALRFGEPGDDRVTGATEDEREAILAAVQDLWNDWCAAGVPLGERS